MILILGGGGYIGSVLTAKLIELGYRVRIYDRFYFGKKSLKNLKNIELIEGDIRNFDVSILDGVETVIHLAGLSNDPTAEFNPKANFEINTTASVKLAQTAKNHGVSRFVFASSCSIYDLGQRKKNFTKNEKSIVKPRAAYSLSKHKAESRLIRLADSKFCVAVLRKATVFGFSPRMRYDLVVNTMLKDALSSGKINIFGEGLHWRPLVEVNDVARAYIKTLEMPVNSINRQIINISLGNFLVRDIAITIQKVLAEKFKTRVEIIHKPSPSKIRSYKVDNQKSQKLLAFKPVVTIEKSIEELVRKIRSGVAADFDNPVYYNIDWMKPILEKGI